MFERRVVLGETIDLADASLTTPNRAVPAVFATLTWLLAGLENRFHANATNSGGIGLQDDQAMLIVDRHSVARFGESAE